MSVASQFYDVANSALECVCSAMDALETDVDGYACPCITYVSAGEPEIDCCVTECDDVGGRLTVHVEDIFASDDFPNPTQGFEPCKAATWVAVIVVTAARCAPSMDEEGNPAPAADLDANALLMALDSYAILTGLGCCLVADAPAGKRKRRVLIQNVTPQSSEGGCAWVEVRAAVETGSVCNCVEVS